VSGFDAAKRVPGNLVDAPVVPCVPEFCFGAAQNAGTISLFSGRVVVSGDGRVIVKLRGLRDIATGDLVRNRTLDVFVEDFVGHVTTDARGNYTGPIVTPAGTRFSFAGTGPHVVQFAFNTPGVRTELISGLSIRWLHTVHNGR
jgi:hypothetical protein